MMNKSTRPSNEALKNYFAGRSLPHEKKLIELYLAMDTDGPFVQECMDQAWKEMQAEGIIPAGLSQTAWKKFVEARDKLGSAHSSPGLRPAPVRRMAPRWVYRVAAVLGFIVLGTWMYKALHKPNQAAAPHYAVFNAGTGHGREVALADGSVAILFPGSSLRVPDDFGGKERRVLLSGKGYFTVRHNDAIPFYTEAAGLLIRDIGTSFQIDASEQGAGRILLKEGKIDIHYNQEPLAALLPGQQMAFDRQTARWQVTSFDTTVAFSWLRGELNYNLAPLEEICADLQNWYGVRIHIPDASLRKKKITAQFTEIPIEKIMDILSASSGFSYRKTGNDITIE